MSDTTDIINNAKYLLEFQKDSLIEDIEDTISPGDQELYCRTLIDEVFRKLFDRGIEDTLSTTEMGMVGDAIREYIRG